MRPRSLLSSVTLIAALGLASGTRAQTGRESLYASITLASDYMRYGLSQTRGDGAWRLALDYEHDSGFFAGGFVANVDYAAETWRRTRDRQIDLYTGFIWRGADWSTSISLSRYYYPGLYRRYDYTELVTGFGFRDRFFGSAGYSHNYLSLDRPAYHYEAGIVWPWLWKLELSVDAGRRRAERFRGARYTYWDVGLSRAFGRFSLDLRYHDNTMNRTTLLGDSAGNRWVLSVSYAIAPRAR